MKKSIFNFILLASVVLFLESCNEKPTDPLRYKGCVVVAKPSGYWKANLEIKLTEKLRDSIGEDYIWIYVPKYEHDMLNVGDTIK